MGEIRKLVKSEQSHPCGCVVITYADDTGLTIPCPPCGLMAAADGMNAAANAMAAVAKRLRADQTQATLNAAARGAKP